MEQRHYYEVVVAMIDLEWLTTRAFIKPLSSCEFVVYCFLTLGFLVPDRRIFLLL